MMRNGTALVSAATLTLVAGLSACADRAARTPEETRPPVAVRVATIGMANLKDVFETGGLVQARTTATMTSRILAPVMAVRVAPGDHVREGQILIVLDGRDLAARMQSAKAAAVGAQQRVTAAEAETRAAEAALALARTTHDRIATLQARRSATSQELDDATASLRAAEARAAAAAAHLQESTAAVAAAKADSDAANTTASFAEIAAPFDGLVTQKMVEAGNMAGPGTPLVRIEDTRGFRLEVRVDESRIGALSVGATVPVVVERGHSSDPQTLSGTIAEVARAVESDTRALLVKIDLPTTSDLRSGMFGRARFTAGARRALAIPSTAVMRRGQVTSAFVVSGGVARLRLINVADTEVLAGLLEGERVIVEPSPEIVDGRRVTEGARQ